MVRDFLEEFLALPQRGLGHMAFPASMEQVVGVQRESADENERNDGEKHPGLRVADDQRQAEEDDAEEQKQEGTDPEPPGRRFRGQKRLRKKRSHRDARRTNRRNRVRLLFDFVSVW